ncbi:MAG: type II toxin-antitoxin system VapC family toxin [Bryobacteraceae bacterium]|jgi:PIN domain nuclease of toxin-antitoxin system
MTIYADTHVLVWLFYGETGRLGIAARQAIDGNEILASPAAVLEIELLHEIGRMHHSASTVVETLATDIGLRVCDLPFRTVVEYAVKENWGRDPFDRLIVANAKAAGAPLLTKDARIRRHYSRAIW